MTILDVNKHLAVVREVRTGKHVHVPLRDLVDQLNGLGFKDGPGPDPRIDTLTGDVATLKERVSSLGNGGPASDPRVDDLVERVVFIEEAIKSLIVRALKEAEA